MQGLNYAKKFRGTTKAKRWSLLGPLHSISHTLYDVHMHCPMLAYKNYENTYKTTCHFAHFLGIEAMKKI